MFDYWICRMTKEKKKKKKNNDQPPPGARIFPVSAAVMAGAQRKWCDCLWGVLGLVKHCFLSGEYLGGSPERWRHHTGNRWLVCPQWKTGWVAHIPVQQHMRFTHTHALIKKKINAEIKPPLNIRSLTMKLSASCFISAMGSSPTDAQLKRAHNDKMPAYWKYGGGLLYRSSLTRCQKTDVPLTLNCPSQGWLGAVGKANRQRRQAGGGTHCSTMAWFSTLVSICRSIKEYY